MKVCTECSMRNKASGFAKRNVLTLAVFVTLAAFAANLMLGASWISWNVLEKLLSGQWSDSEVRILIYVRLPRTVGAAFAGFGLASAGVLIQKVLGNPLAGPNLIGINAGAGFGVSLCIAVFPQALALTPVFAFLGAFAAALIVAALGRRTGASRVTVVLAGAALGTAFSAASDTLHTFFPDAVLGGTAYRIGSLSGISVKALIPACAVIAAAFAAAFLMRNELDILSLGEETAMGLGMRTGRYRFLLLALAAAMAGAAVSFAGLLGFVGLLVPHAARRLGGTTAGKLLPTSGFMGAALVLICEIPARTLFAPYELPVGIFLSLLGVPFFLWLLLSKKGARMLDE